MTAATPEIRLPIAARLRGFDCERTAIAFVAVAFVGFSTPQALNFLRILPVGVALLLWALHLTTRSTRRVGSIRVPLIAVALLAWCALSVLWSDGPAITVVETVSTTLAVVVALIAGTFASLQSLIKGIAIGGLIVVALSLVVAAVDPSVGLMPPGYQGHTLRGIYVHRNILASVLTTPLAAGLAARWDNRRPRLTWAAVVVVILGGIGLTASSTSVATAGALIALAVTLAVMRRTALRWRMVALLAVLALALTAAWEIDTNTSSVFMALGRSDTLTGRTLIWEAVRLLIDRRPVTGYGWGATWDPSDFVASYVSAYAKFQVPSAHNGYLDAWVQIGIVGLVLLLLMVLLVLLAGARAMLRSDSVFATFPALFVVALIVHNLSETNLVDPLIVFVLVAVLARFRADARASAGRQVAAQQAQDGDPGHDGGDRVAHDAGRGRAGRAG